ncbi:hypothetical protein EPO34_01110 [Patescibacteria group bacterium]|nr:MAG: hypothetical protein EPO34_01110 [Patescibacteria group bacterium]
MNVREVISINAFEQWTEDEIRLFRNSFDRWYESVYGAAVIEFMRLGQSPESDFKVIDANGLEAYFQHTLAGGDPNNVIYQRKSEGLGKVFLPIATERAAGLSLILKKLPKGHRDEGRAIQELKKILNKQLDLSDAEWIRRCEENNLGLIVVSLPASSITNPFRQIELALMKKTNCRVNLIITQIGAIPEIWMADVVRLAESFQIPHIALHERWSNKVTTLK